MEKHHHHHHDLRLTIVELAIVSVLSVFILVFKEHLIGNIKYFVGAIMIFDGVEEIVLEVIHERKGFWKNSKAYQGFIDIIFGISLLCLSIDPEIEYIVVCVVWASWSIVRESHEIKRIVTDVRCITPRIISAVESVGVIVFSFMLILEPGEHHAMIHLYILIIELIFTPLTDLMDELISRFKEKKKEASKEEIESNE